jgi:hypothetical protein
MQEPRGVGDGAAVIRERAAVFAGRESDDAFVKVVDRIKVHAVWFDVNREGEGRDAAKKNGCGDEAL